MHAHHLKMHPCVFVRLKNHDFVQNLQAPVERVWKKNLQFHPKYASPSSYSHLCAEDLMCLRLILPARGFLSSGANCSIVHPLQVSTGFVSMTLFFFIFFFSSHFLFSRMGEGMVSVLLFVGRLITPKYLHFITTYSCACFILLLYKVEALCVFHATSKCVLPPDHGMLEGVGFFDGQKELCLGRHGRLVMIFMFSVVCLGVVFA